MSKQKRCLICAHYDVEKDSCKIDECAYERLKYPGYNRSRFRRRSKDIYKDLFGNKID